jgi:methyl-accepting chemotaxis protein
VGVQYVKPAMALLLALEQEQAQHAGQGAGAALGSAVQQQWQAMQQTHTALNPVLGVDKEWSALDAAWKKLQSAPQPDNFQAASSSLRALISQASDQSNLTLDPDIDTYYLMDVLITHWPDWLSQSMEANSMLMAAKGQALGGRRVTPC